MPPFSATQAVKDALALAFRRFPLLFLVSLLGLLATGAVIATGYAPIAAWITRIGAEGAWVEPPSSLYPTLLFATLGLVYAASAQIAVLGLDVRGGDHSLVDALWVGLKGMPALLLGHLLLGLFYIAMIFVGSIAVALLDTAGILIMVALLGLAFFFQIIFLPWPFLAVVEGKAVSAFTTARELTRGRRGAIFGGLLLLALALVGVGIAGGLLAVMLGAIVGIFSFEGALIAGIVAGIVQMLFHGYTGAATLAYVAVVYEHRVFLAEDGATHG